MDRRGKLQMMKDILDHLGLCFDEYQQADGGRDLLLADSIQRDLNEFRRLCDSLRSSHHRMAVA